MVSFDFTVKLSKIYDWVLDVSEGDPRGSLFREIFSNDGQGGHGQEYCLWFLIIVSFLTAAIFYFGIAKNIQNATKKNYLSTYVMGYICLVAINYVGMQLIVDANVLTSFNMVKVCLVDILYYTILFEVASLIFKQFSDAGNIHLFNISK